MITAFFKAIGITVALAITIIGLIAMLYVSMWVIFASAILLVFYFSFKFLTH
jgi:hypothetical protein